jgi:hypothetical protein
MSDTLVIALWIVGPFVVAALVTAFTRAPAILIAVLVSVAIVLLQITYIDFVVRQIAARSTVFAVIHLSSIRTVLGGVAGAFAGWPLRKIFSRSKRNSAN